MRLAGHAAAYPWPMSEVLTGKGPQPPSVYWIRRGLVVLVAVVLIGVLVWVFTPKGQPVTATPEATGSPSATESMATETPSADASPTASPSATDGTSPSSTPTASSAVAACEAIGVQLELTGFKSVKSGANQTFSVTAENNTALPCVMAIDADTFVLWVNSGKDPIWSTAHCEKWLPEVKKQTLKAGKAVEFKVTWKTFRSAEGCKTVSGSLGAGTYVATATYLKDSTRQLAFQITKGS